MGTDLISQESEEWSLLKKQCTAFIMSNLLPSHIYQGTKNEGEVLARAVTIAFKGRELGIPPLYALSSIAVINGKPALSAELMLSLVLRKFPQANPEFSLASDSCSLTMTRPGGKPQTFKFTMEDAKRAGLVRPNSPWEKYPRAMLKARVTSEACRSLFPDALLGAVYTPEELGHNPIDIIHHEEQSNAVLIEKESKPSGNTIGYDERHQKKMEEPCTEPQRKKLYAMTKELGWNKEESKEWLFEKFGVESSKELTKEKIQIAFELLSKEKESPEVKSLEESDQERAGLI